MDSVPGRPDDFRHIGPHGIEAGGDKRTAIPGSGNRNFTGVGLIPETVDDIRSPVIISQGTVFRIDHPGKNAFGTFLNATKTAHAGIQVFRFAHCAGMRIIFPENPIDTFFS